MYFVSYSDIRFSLAIYTNPDGSLGPLQGHNLDLTVKIALNSKYSKDLYDTIDFITKPLDHKTIISKTQTDVDFHYEDQNVTISWLDYTITIPQNEIYFLNKTDTHMISILEEIIDLLIENLSNKSNIVKIEVIGSDLPYRNFSVSREIN